MKKLLSFVLILMLVFAIAVPASANGFTATNYEPTQAQASLTTAEIAAYRLAGENRFKTAVEISKETFTTSENAILVDGFNYPDALAVTPLAHALNAPVFMVNTVDQTMDTATWDELQRLGVKNIYLLGGTEVMSEEFENTLKKSFTKVTRIAGDDRYETAALIAKELAKYVDYDTAVVAYGGDYPDALSVGSGAAVNGQPILFTATDSTPKVTSDVLAGVDNIVIVGGTSVISKATEGALGKIAATKRLAGDNRYLTAIAIQEEYFEKADTIYAATGRNYADALTGGVAAAKNNAPMILVDGQASSVPSATTGYIRWTDATDISILGGQKAINDTVAEILIFALSDNYRVAYFANGGTFPSTGSDTTGWKTLTWDAEVYYPTEDPTRDGYVFTGWKTRSGVDVTAGMTYAEVAGNDSALISEAVFAQWMSYDEQATSLVDIDSGMRTIEHLSKNIGVRLSGTAGEEAAIDWILNEFDSLGLETEKFDFATGTATRPVSYLTVHDAEKYYGLGAFDRQVNGTYKGGAYQKHHGTVWQAGAAENGTITGSGTGSKITGDIVFVGTLGTNAVQDDFDAVDLAGKIALIGTTVNADRATMAADAGAIAIMGFSPTPGSRGNHGQASNPKVTAATPGATIPSIGLARCQGEWFMAMLGTGDTITIDIQTEVLSTPTSWDAVGIKPAKNDPENAPIIFITGHIDSVNGSPGANDNASGVAVTLEAARILMQLDTDNVEIRFIAFGSEEVGLLGARAYVASMDKAEKERVIGVFNMDMTGSQDEERATYWCMMTTDGESNLVTDTFIDTANRLGYGDTVELGKFSSSDHVPFTADKDRNDVPRNDVPMPAAMGMWFGRPEGNTDKITPTNYTIEAAYHTPLDTIEENVSVRRIEMCIEVVSAAVYQMAREYEAPNTGASVTAPAAFDIAMLEHPYAGNFAA